MSRQTRTFYVDREAHANSNANICAEIVSSARLDNLANSNLPLKTRGSKGDREVRVTVQVETVKKLSPAKQLAAELKAIDNLAASLSPAGWEHLMEVSANKARADIRERSARRAPEKAASSDSTPG